MKAMNLVVFFALFVFQGVVLAGNNCHPESSKKEQNYIIGYGSLIQQSSRMSTTPSAINAYPVQVKGFQRSWGIHGGHYPITFLTLTANKEASLNAVYYPVTADGISSSDKREKGYCRASVPLSSITALGLSTLPKGQYWIYTQRNNRIEKPTQASPIVQSYVDIFLGGCIDIGKTYNLKNFVINCITETKAWPTTKGTWINDRVHARRPFAIPHAFYIDTLLASYFPGYYKNPLNEG